MRIHTLALAPFICIAAQSVRAQDAPSQEQYEKAVLIRMKSDLRNLVTAQEAYFADQSSYASSMDGLRFRPSESVSIRLTVTQNAGWAAETRSSLLPRVACVVWINLKEEYRPALGKNGFKMQEGEPGCAVIDDKP